MADHMHPTSIQDLTRWVFDELASRGSVFGLPKDVFHQAWASDPFGCEHHGCRLETPLGVAAGPHTQLAPNLVTAYLAGARFIELKTVQTLDELQVTKPCIDMQDVGYNCEWSQELRLPQSFEEYAKAWVLIQALRAHLGWTTGPEHGFLFNMSVGYNLEGIQSSNVQSFLTHMRNSREHLRELCLAAAREQPALADLPLSETLSESITLSTMHGCPPDEIERIGLYLIEELGVHTAIKLNPTLLGSERLRAILNGELGFTDIQVPDQAFEHDPAFADALAIVRSLSAAAARRGVFFWVKLTNTLETVNLRHVLPADEAMHYMSGRALHPLAVQLAADLSAVFEGRLPLSLSGGADAFNLPDLLAGGIRPVTVCSDALRPGGYGRLSQYLEVLATSMTDASAGDLDEFACRQALADTASADKVFTMLAARLQREPGLSMGPVQFEGLRRASAMELQEPLRTRVVRATSACGLDGAQAESLVDELVICCQMVNLERYARATRIQDRYHSPRQARQTKTARPLGPFDCIGAPCIEGCPSNQNVPDYMHLVAQGRYDDALEVILRSNPLPSITGTVCDHPCMNKCVRSHYDSPLAIREIKRFVTERATTRSVPVRAAQNDVSVAVIGAGPAGLAAAYYLALAGCQVVVFDERVAPGGVPAQVIPSYRLPDDSLAVDIEGIAALGVTFEFEKRLGREFQIQSLKERFGYVFIGTGAGQGMELRIEGEQTPGVYDCLAFLNRVRRGGRVELGDKVLVIGGGNSAMDAARTAWRLVGQPGRVSLVYRRTEAQMPADDEELEALRDEGIDVRVLTAPARVVVRDGKLVGLECLDMELGEVDGSGRPRPVPIEGSQTVLPADSILVAVGQRPEVGPLLEAGLALTKWDTLAVDDTTGETSVAGVFAGGDVLRGGGSIIQAAADARRCAWTIMDREGIQRPGEPELAKPGEARTFLACKSRRVYPETIPSLPLDQRHSFEQVGLPLSEEQAQREAARCLDCDEFCGLCMTVCPNRANHLYRTEAFDTLLPELRVVEGRVERIGERRVQITQASQIVNLADLCNECGNCEAFCPTQGAPYRDKPRLCFTEESFAEEACAYRLLPTGDGWRMERKEADGLHRLTLSMGRLLYRSPSLVAELDVAGFNVATLMPGPDALEGERVLLTTCAGMFVIARSLITDSTFLPGLSVRA
jgi:NADPH-dependent glutamate synthase beta subunit-like oxidoreductase